MKYMDKSFSLFLLPMQVLYFSHHYILVIITTDQTGSLNNKSLLAID